MTVGAIFAVYHVRDANVPRSGRSAKRVMYQQFIDSDGANGDFNLATKVPLLMAVECMSDVGGSAAEPDSLGSDVA